MSNQEQTTQDQTVDDDIDERLATHDLLDTAAASGNFTRFLAAVSATGLESLLRGPDLLTVFIPVNQAFEQVRDQVGHGVDLGRLADIVRYHIVPGALTAAEIGTGQTLKTLQGLPLHVVNEDGSVRVGGASIVQPDVECTNGTLHGIDRVLLP